MSRRARSGFVQKPSAVCVTAYDVHGAPLSKALADKVVQAVEDTVKAEGESAQSIVINYTRG